MSLRFHIESSRQARPASLRTLHCDGGWGSDFRDDRDLHLSHWIPNRTPARYKADTSTGICLNFAADRGALSQFDLVVNDHVDVDGTLSLYVLVHPEAALAQRELLVQAAAMGDFWAWGEGRAALLFQRLTLLIDRMGARQDDPNEIVRAGFDCITSALGDRVPGEVAVEAVGEPAHDEAHQVLEGLAALQAGIALIDSGAVRRTRFGEALTLFEIPSALSRGNEARCLCVPRFGTPLSHAMLLWPQARARLDRERAHLVAVQLDGGWTHELWLPGHAWAETPTLRHSPGLVPTEGSNEHRYAWPPLDAAAARLQAAETAPGQWCLATRLSAFSALPGRGFPVVLSFMLEGRPAPSGHAPRQVAALLGEALAAESADRPGR